jgi:hypothetical protein
MDKFNNTFNQLNSLIEKLEANTGGETNIEKAVLT